VCLGVWGGALVQWRELGDPDEGGAGHGSETFWLLLGAFAKSDPL
jgi:hypothetical protein